MEVRAIVPLRQIEYGVYGDLIILYPKPIFYLLKGGLNLLGEAVRIRLQGSQGWGMLGLLFGLWGL